MDIKETLTKAILDAARAAIEAGELPAGELPEVVLEVPPEKAFGDFATNFAMQSARVFHKSPRQIAEVISARALSEAQQRQTEEALSARYGGEVKAIFKTNPALLGGLQIWCRGELIDGSLQGRLAKLQAELAQ